MVCALFIAILFVGIAAAFAWRDDSKIVGGRFVDDVKSIPFIVSIHVKNQGHNCGGSLLTPYYVLTACHCMAALPEDDEMVADVILFEPEDFLFVAGAADFERDMGYAQVREPTKFHIHPNCSRLIAAVFDVAAAEVKRPFDITERVKPFGLLTTRPEEFQRKFFSLISRDSTVCQVAGWGETRRGDVEEPKASSKLKAVRMFLIPNKECQKLYGEREEEFAEFPFSAYNQICAVSTRDKNESDCLGDSGSPFFCNDYVVGVVSYGFECGTYMPSVYNDLQLFLEWFMSDVYPLRPDYMKIDYLNGRSINESSVPPSLAVPVNEKNRTSKISCSWLCYIIPSVLQAVWIFLC